MPVVKLFVEGALEVQLLTPILQGSPVPQQGGSKNSLKPRAGRNAERIRLPPATSGIAISILIRLQTFQHRRTTVWTTGFPLDGDGAGTKSKTI